MKSFKLWILLSILFCLTISTECLRKLKRENIESLKSIEEEEEVDTNDENVDYEEVKYYLSIYLYPHGRESSAPTFFHIRVVVVVQNIITLVNKL